MGRPTTGRPTLYQKPKLFRQILFRLRREILHILYALEHGRSVVLEIQTPPELIERTETLPLGPTVDVLVHFGNDFESLLVDRRADLHCLAPHKSALTAASPSCTPVETERSNCGNTAEQIATIRRTLRNSVGSL